MKRTLVLIGGMTLLGWGAIGASSQVLFTLSPDTRTGAPGTDLVFSGTITNSGGATVFLNNDSINLIGVGLTTDDSKFFANVPAFLNAGASTGLVGLFDVSIDPATAFGMYPGSFSIVGGADANAQGTLVTSNFSVVVASSAVPEGSSFVSLLSGLGALGALVGISRLRRSRTSLAV